MRPVPFYFLYEPIAGLSHLLAAVLTVYAGWRLILKARGDGFKVGAAFLYAGCLLALFSISGAYHSLPPGPWKDFFHRLDYMAIWLVIAGSATPVHLLLLRGFWRWGMLAVFWAWALTNLLILDGRYSRLPYAVVVGLYLAVSVIAAVSLYRLHRRFSARTLATLTMGCLLYVAGALIDYIEAPVLIPHVVGPHELFHLFVVAAAACHYVFIYGWVDLKLRKVKLVLRRPARYGRTAPARGS